MIKAQGSIIERVIPINSNVSINTSNAVMKKILLKFCHFLFLFLNTCVASIFTIRIAHLQLKAEAIFVFLTFLFQTQKCT